MKRFSFLLYFIVFFFMNGAAQAASPYPPSPVIEKVTWDHANRITKVVGSDLWPITWGPDDNIYTSFGDGWGFRTNPVKENYHIGLGFAKIVGGPLDWVGTNTYAPEITTWVGGGSWWSGAVFNGGGKVAGMLSVNGVLYGWKNTQDKGEDGPSYRLMWSNDLGRNWNESTWSWDSPVFAPSTFLNFGKNYAGALDGFVYSYGGAWSYLQPPIPDHDNVHLIRVPKDNIADKTKYEYYSGDQAGNPAWTKDINGRRPVFTDPNLSNTVNGSELATVVYNPIIKRYLLTVAHGGSGNFGLFEGPEPWGPWTTVAYESSWGGNSNNTGTALFYNFVNKWTSADGLTMWMVYSGGPPDSYNQVKATLKLRQSSEDTTSPASPKGLVLK